MKSRFIFSLCSIALAATLVAGGFSLAWLGDEDAHPDIPAVITGTVDYNITDAALIGYEEEEQWHRGDRRDFAWTLHNTGTKAVYYRARLIESLDGETETTEDLIDWELTADAVWIYKKDSSTVGWYYSQMPVKAGDTISLQLTGTLADEDVQSGDYEVVLETEAVQATSDAVDEIWESHPYGEAK